MAAIRDRVLPIAIGLVLVLGCGAWASELGAADPARRVDKSRGSKASDKALSAGIKWLAAHQMPDGGWSFDLKTHPTCRGQCGNSGSEAKARNAATALALLPFLKAGYTHKRDQHKETVKKGWDFLIERMKVDPNGGSLHEPGGTMYSHGLASIALCEAYTLTKDKSLEPHAQAALDFIVFAQDPVGGGWRYQPKQTGDTSVTGWQILALKSGHMAYLRVPPTTLQKVDSFLDSVQSDEGAKYGYNAQHKSGRHTTTAIGLLCRMYLGWKKDDPTLKRGVQWLAEQGPSKTNLYYNYFATEVMWLWGGKEWEKWNPVNRDWLVKSQATEGHEAGSWGPGKGADAQQGPRVKVDDHGTRRGGRLYHTAMAKQILEVYYYPLRIPRQPDIEEDFPLD